MSAMTESYLFLQALATHSERLQALLGDDWPAFQEKLDALLQRVAESDDEQQLLFLVDEIITLGLDGPAAELVRALLRQAQEETGTVDSATRSVHMRDPTSGATREVVVKDAAAAGRDEVVAAVFALGQVFFLAERAVIRETSPK